MKSLPRDTIIVTGGARGIDAESEAIAKALGYPSKVVVAEWDKYGLAAGPKRNQKMLDQFNPTDVFAFRISGKSIGTDHMVKIATERGCNVVVVHL